MLRELASLELQPMADVLTVLPQANKEMLSRLLHWPVPGKKEIETCAACSCAGFVVSGQNNLIVHKESMV